MAAKVWNASYLNELTIRAKAKAQIWFRFTGEIQTYSPDGHMTVGQVLTEQTHG